MEVSSTPSKVFLITGTSRGIGKFLAQAFCEQGHFVFGFSRSTPEWTHSNYTHVSGDVTNESDVRNLMTTIRKNKGKLDIVINNAGIASMNHSLLVPLQTVKNIFDINFMGTFVISREASRLLMKASHPRIVNFTTVAAALDLEGEAVYAASKSAVESLTRILAKEVAHMKITVNALGPTPVKTDLIKNVPQEKLQKLLDQQSLKRFGEFNDVKNVIDFFISESSDFITGQILYLGGVVK